MNVPVLLSVVGIFGILGCSQLGQALRFIEEPTSIVALRNSQALLKCTATSSSTIDIFWLKDGVRIQSDSNRVVLPSGHLVLRRLRGKKGAEFDEGTYQCFASTKEGTIASRKARVQLAVLSRTFKQWPQNITIWQGETARFACQLKRAIPDPVISWEKDGQKIIAVGRRVVLPNGVLQILQAQKSDEGQYKCVLQNMARQRTSIPGRLAVKQVMPAVRDPVHFAVIPGNTSAISGHQVTMECIATGIPIPTVQWKKVGRHNEQNATTANKGSSNLQISSVSVRDQGEYLCVVSWGGNTIRRSAFLFVKEPPHFIIKPPTNDVATAGRTIKLVCSAMGSPMPNITWLKDGQPVTINSRVIMTKNGLDGNLTIKKVSERDKGVYQCFAENYLGSMQSSTSLRVIVNRSGQPPASRILSADPISDSEVNVKWQAVSNVVAYAVTYRPVDNSTQEYSQVEKSTNCILNYLQGYTEYSLYVTPFFKKHGGQKSAPVTVRTLEGRPKSPPTNILLASYTPDSIDIQWVPPSKKYRNGIITGYIIRYIPKDGPSTSIQVPRNFNQMTVNSLISGKTYSFEVAATTSVGVGPFSPSKDFTVATKAYNVISAPTMSIRPINSTALEVTWHAPKFGGNKIQNYKLSYTKDSSSIDQHGPLNINKTKKKFVITGLNPNTKYIVRLMAWDGKKLGQPSVQVGTTAPGTPTGKPGPQNDINVKCQPYRPTSLSVSWQAVFVPKKVDVSYQVNYEVKGNLNHATLLTKEVLTTRTLLSSLRPGQTYRITVKPFDNNNQEISGFAGSTVECDTPEAKPSSAPRNVQFKVKSKQTLNLSWEPPSKPNGKITNYVIAYTSNENLPDDQWKTHKKIVLSSFLSRFEKSFKNSLHGLSYNSTYFIKIKAGNKQGYGPWGPYGYPIKVLMVMDKDRKTVDPPKLTFQYISSSVMKISWRHPVSSQGKPLRYRVIYTTNPTLPYTEWFQLLVVVKLWTQKSERSVSVQLANLSVNQTYYVKVQADYGTLIGPWSNQLRILTHEGQWPKQDNNSDTDSGATSSDSRKSTEKKDFEIKLGIIIGCVISAFCIVVLVLFIIWRCPCRFGQAKNQAPASKKNGLPNGAPNGLSSGLPNGYSVSNSHQSVVSNRLGQGSSYEESSGGSSIGSSVCQCKCTCSAGRWPQLPSMSQPQNHVGNGHIITGNGHLVTPNQGPPQSKPYSMPLADNKVLNGYVLQEPPVPLQILTVQENGNVVVGAKSPNSKSISVDV